MTLHLAKQSAPPGGAVVELDLDDIDIANIKLVIRDRAPTMLTFDVTAKPHQPPLETTDFLIFWDDTGTLPDTSPQTQAKPAFEGYPEDIVPNVDGQTISYVCYDVTYRARRIPVMSIAWSTADTPNAAASPRAVYNVTQTNDDDYALAMALGTTIGRMISQALDDANLPLVDINCGGGYVSSELKGTLVTGSGPTTGPYTNQSGGITLEPQEKVVSNNESVPQFLDRLLQQWEPAWRYRWRPGTSYRQWRFYDAGQSARETLTIGDPNPATHGTILSIQLQRSLDGRATAIEFYGPEVVTWATATWEDGGVGNTLDNISDGGVLHHPFASSGGLGDPSGYKNCYNKFQIIDLAFTRVARKAPTPIYAPGEVGIWTNTERSVVTNVVETAVVTYGPSVQMKFDASNAGNGNWRSVTGWTLDFRTGVIDFGTSCLFRYNANPSTPDGKIETPTFVKIEYPKFGTPAKVRYPASGFEGTAYTLYGLEHVQRIYDEALATAYMFGNPVTTALRHARYTELAQRILARKRDAVHAGVFEMDGLWWDAAWLDKRVDFTGKDADGAGLTIGWETVGAAITEVTYDFENQVTTVQTDSDFFELLGIDADTLRQELGIRPADPIFIVNFDTIHTTRAANTHLGNRLIGQDTLVIGNVDAVFQDEFGGVQ